MKSKTITAKEIVDTIYTGSRNEEEKQHRLGLLKDGIRCHKEAVALESRARQLIEELVEGTEGSKNDE